MPNSGQMWPPVVAPGGAIILSEADHFVWTDADGVTIAEFLLDKTAITRTFKVAVFSPNGALRASADLVAATDVTIIPRTFSAIDDTNGLMYWLGTHAADGSVRAWQNPSLDAGALVASASAPLYSGYPIEQATDHAGAGARPALVQTGSPVGAWVQWRIADSKRKFKPNYYVLHGNDEAGSAQLRSWKLQGSNDGASWTDLDVRASDSTIGQNVPRGFAVADAGQSFSYFRILQTGVNSDNSSWLAIGEIELYGDLHISAA